MWDQLKARTKTGDYSRQRVIGHLNQAMLPLISAMEVLNEDITVSKATDDTRKLMAYINKLKECVGDGYKIMCQTIRTTNQQRREADKKEMTPKFKTLCGADHPASATKLFGDSLVEDSKQIDSAKSVKMTTHT